MRVLEQPLSLLIWTFQRMSSGIENKLIQTDQVRRDEHEIEIFECLRHQHAVHRVFEGHLTTLIRDIANSRVSILRLRRTLHCLEHIPSCIE